MSTRGLTIVAVAVLALAVVMLVGDGLARPGSGGWRSFPVPTATPVVDARSVARPSQTAEHSLQDARGARRTARAFTVAAVNAGPRTAARARRVQARLAAGALRARLRQRVPTGVVLHRGDAFIRLGAVFELQVRSAARDEAIAVADVDQLDVSQGLRGRPPVRARQTIRYRLELRHTGRAWRVTAFDVDPDAHAFD